MLDKLKYINHLGEIFEFGRGGLFANISDVRDYNWGYDTTNDRISSYKMGVVTKSLPFVIKTQEVQASDIIERIADIANKDILATKYGRLYIGDNYLNCNITGVSQTDYLIHKTYAKGTLTLVTDDSYWRCEKTLRFVKNNFVENSGVEFPFDYPFDYKSSLNYVTSFNNPYGNVEFIMTIWGVCNNPTIIINGHTYKVNVSLNIDEFLEINSAKKTITKSNSLGNISNEFKNRYKEQSVFEQIKSGNNSINWNGTFGFDLTLLAKKSLPIREDNR